jgi:hypothetical protein
MVQSHADLCRAGQLRWNRAPPGIPSEMAVEFLAKLKAGSTLRKLTAGGKKLGPAMVTFDRFKKHSEMHPEWAAEAWRISKINASIGRGVRFRNLTHCKHGHPLGGARIRHYKGWTVRDCLRCEEIRRNKGGTMKPEAVVKVTAALKGGATISQIIHGRPAGGGKLDRSLRIVDAAILARYRRNNPEFDRFITEAVVNNNSVGQKIRYAREKARARIQASRDQLNDYHKIRAMLPAI